jgi:hypothetical protein
VDIAIYIRELLFGHDCVIIPDFGGFIGNYIAARIDKSTDVFFPPAKQISFNKNLNTNDGLLIGKISEANGIGFNEARAIVAKYVAELRKRLDNGETVVLDHIGAFVNNSEGNVQFEPDDSANYCLNSFGLESFQCMPIEEYDVRKKIITPVVENTEKRVRLRRIIWRAAVIAPLLILMLAAPLSTDVFKPKVETSTLNPLVTLEFEHNKPAIDNSAPIENVVITPPVETNNVPVENLEKPVIEGKIISSIKYQLIIGSFQALGNAQRQANALIAKGFMPEIIPASNGFFRVCAVECSDIETAKLRRENILSIFPETWILKKE